MVPHLNHQHRACEQPRFSLHAATSQVREATDRTTGERWACKAMPLPPADAARRAERAQRDSVLREVAAMLDLAHPGVVQLREYFVQAGKAYLVLELLRGEGREMMRAAWAAGAHASLGLAAQHSKRGLAAPAAACAGRAGDESFSQAWWRLTAQNRNAAMSTISLLCLPGCAGGELLEVINTRGPLSEDVARDVFRRLLEGVRYLHSM